MKKLVRLLGLSAFGLFLYMPIFVVSGSSLNSSRQMVFPPVDPGFTWYIAFFNDPTWVSALTTSIVIALCSSLVATTLATVVAYLLWRRQSRLHEYLYRAVLIPFLLPGIVFAVSLSFVIAAFGIMGTKLAIIVGHAAVIIAIPLVTINLGFSLISKEQIEAARTMGVREFQLLPMVLVPMVRPYVLTGALFALIISMNEYVIAFLLSGFSVETLPIKVYNSQRYGFTPTLSVGTVLYMTFSLVVFTILAVTGRLYSLLGIDEKRH